MTPPARNEFRYELGDEDIKLLKGVKLESPLVTSRPLVIQPGNRERAALITMVSDVRDIGHIGELAFNVRPSKGVAIEHETFVTVESGIRQGKMGSKNVRQRSELDAQRGNTVDIVRHRLLEDWYEVLQAGEDYENGLLEMVSADMALVRTLLRRDTRARVSASIGFMDKLQTRKNPMANAARLTAAIARLHTQIAFDAIVEKSMRNRYLTCTTVAERIAQDIFDLQIMATRNMEPTRLQRQVALRVNRLVIKPYFWAVVWIRNNFEESQYSEPEVLQQIIAALLAEQTLGQIDMLLSEYKRTGDNLTRRRVLQLMMMTLSGVDVWPKDYRQLGKEVRNKVRKDLAITASTTPGQYKARAEAVQVLIRGRAHLFSDRSPWFIPGTEELIQPLLDASSM